MQPAKYDGHEVLKTARAYGTTREHAHNYIAGWRPACLNDRMKFIDHRLGKAYWQGVLKFFELINFARPKHTPSNNGTAGLPPGCSRVNRACRYRRRP